MKRELDQTKAPLYEALVAHAKRQAASFHIPGHKSGHGLDSLADDYFASVMAIDMTEITGLDDLHQPDGVIDEAQRLAAQCFQAEESYLLVGGSTVGNLAMILSVCERGDILLVQRNSHKSVLHGLMLAGVQAVFITPAWSSEQSTSLHVDRDDVARALQLYPQARGLILTNPNYYGSSMDLRDIAQLLHKTDKVLLVDEAHGAHFAFHPNLPPAALTCGADLVVQSTHKMLTSLTMGALLHKQGNRVDTKRVKRYLAMLQSSSPSYPILASIDLTRRQLHNNGELLISQGLDAVHTFCSKLRESYPWFGMAHDMLTLANEYQDPFKVLLEDRTGTLTGYALQVELEARSCFVELANEKHVLLIFSIGSSSIDAHLLLQALEAVSELYCLQKKELSQSPSNIVPNQVPSTISHPVLMDANYTSIASSAMIQSIAIDDIEQAVGHCAAEDIIPYPPGIPLCMRGETITAQVAAQIKDVAKQGARFQGTSAKHITHIHFYN
jgi:arginine decarboxylase